LPLICGKVFIYLGEPQCRDRALDRKRFGDLQRTLVEL